MQTISSTASMLACVTAIVVSVPAQTLTTFTIPGAYVIGAAAINNAGDITGSFSVEGPRRTRGFIRALGGNLTVFDVSPTATSTVPTAINDSGVITGYFDGGCFVRTPQGDITTFDVAGRPAHPVAINNLGDIVGFATTDQGLTLGFRRDRQGSVTILPLPQGLEPAGCNTRGDIIGRSSLGPVLLDRHNNLIGLQFPDLAWLTGINDSGDITGYLSGSSGFVRVGQGSTFTFNASPLARLTTPRAINQQGDVAGFLLEDYNRWRGFFRDYKGNITVFDVPGDFGITLPVSINDRGDIVGSFYIDTPSQYVAYAFLRTRK